MKTKVFVVDDHPLLRQGIKQLIDGASDMETCGEADSAGAAIELIARAEPDLAILDISLKDTSGIELLKQLKVRFPALKILMLSMHDESVVVQRALLAGASGYVVKEEASDKALAAIRHVLAGNIYLSRQIANRLGDWNPAEGDVIPFDSIRRETLPLESENTGQTLYSPFPRCIPLREERMQEMQ